MDKTKFIQKLKTKYKNLGFSDKAFQGVADYIATTLGDEPSEEDIDNAVGGVEGLLKVFHGYADSRVTAAIEKAKKEAHTSTTKQETGGDPDPKNEPKPDDNAPEWAKTFAKQMETLAGSVAELKTEKTTSTRKQALEEKLKEAPSAFKNKILKDFNRMKFESDEDFNTYLEETETDLSEAMQEESNQSLGQQSRPFTGQRSNDDKKATEEEVKEVVDQIM